MRPLAALVALVLAACSAAPPGAASPAPRAAAWPVTCDPGPAPPGRSEPVGPEISGLRASTPKVERRPGLVVDVDWQVEWTRDPTATWDGEVLRLDGMWLLKGAEQVQVTFFDAVGLEVGTDSAWVGFSDEFRRREERVRVHALRVRAPPGAVTVSVALGRSGLETTPAPIVDVR